MFLCFNVVVPPMAMNFIGHPDGSMVTIKENDELELKCNVSGARPKPKVEWYKDGNKFDPGKLHIKRIAFSNQTNVTYYQYQINMIFSTNVFKHILFFLCRIFCVGN